MLTAPLACAAPVHEGTSSRLAASATPSPTSDPQIEPSGDEFDVGSLELLMRSMVEEIRTVQTPEELEWALSDLIVGGPLEDFLTAASAALLHVDDADLEVTTDNLDPDLQGAVHRFLLTTQVDLSLLRTLEDGPLRGSGQRAHGLTEHWTRGGSREGAGESERPTFQELLYGDALAPPIQEALYAGHVAFLALLTLLDDQPVPEWLRSELKQQMVCGQHLYLTLIVAFARQAGVALPTSLESMEAIDLDQAEREAEREQRAVDSYLSHLRASRTQS